MKIRKPPIGILGDGQLALMLGEAALNQKSSSSQGIDFLGFGSDTSSSFATRFPDRFVLGDVREENAINEFARTCSVLTLENEFIPAAILARVESASATQVIPSLSSYQFFEGKISQRRFYEKNEILGPKWAVLKGEDCPLPFPVVVKTSEGGYDGYGVRVASQVQEFKTALQELGYAKGNALLVEEKVSIEKEFAQGVLLDGQGNFILLPLVETVQRKGICEMVLARPTLSSEKLKEVTLAIRTNLTKIAKAGLKGLFNFEFFLTKDGRVLINEGAPRPHNSQHLTLDASPVSQFSLLMDFLATGSLHADYMNGDTVPIRAGVMINLLGKSKGENYSLKLPALPAEIEVYPKLYLKKECRPGRKMGHLNLIDPSGKHNLIELAERVLKEYEL